MNELIFGKNLTKQEKTLTSVAPKFQYPYKHKGSLQELDSVKKYSKQAFNSYCSACMAAICYRDPISAVPTNEQLLSEERIGAKFQIDSLKTEGLVRVYTDRRTDIAKSTQLIMLSFIQYLSSFIESSTFPSGCYKLRCKLSI